MRTDDEDARRAGAAPGASGREALTFDSLFERYLGEVLAYVRSRVPRYEDAEDITAETFEAAWIYRAKFRGEGERKAWLLGIARRKSALAARRLQQGRGREWLAGDLSKVEQETLDGLRAANAQQFPEDEALRGEVKAVVRRLLAGLPDAQREAVLLRFYHGLSAKEIGRVTGRRVAAVNSLLQRARATILREGKGYFQP